MRNRLRVVTPALAVSVAGVAILLSAPAPASETIPESLRVSVASTGAYSDYRKPGFLPFDPVTYAALPSTQATADYAATANAFAAFFDPAGHITRDASGTMNLVGAPAPPFDPSYPFFATASYPPAPGHESDLPAVPAGPTSIAPGETKAAAKEGFAQGTAKVGAVDVAEGFPIAVGGAVGTSTADAKAGVGVTTARLTKGALGNVLTFDELVVEARVAYEGHKPTGSGLVKVLGAHLFGVPVDFTDQGLVIGPVPVPAPNVPNASELLTQLASHGFTLVPPTIELIPSAGSYNVRVHGPALETRVEHENPHEINIVRLQSGFAVASLAVGEDSFSTEPAPAEGVGLTVPSNSADGGTGSRESSVDTNASPMAEVSPSNNDVGVGQVAANADSLLLGTDKVVSGTGGAVSSPNNQYGLQTGTAAGLETGSPASSRNLATVPAVQTRGIRRGTMKLFAMMWLASIVALLLAAAWRRIPLATR